jgi:hypothetical protein
MAYAQQCERCKRVIPPRGNITPRFCPYCGERLGGPPVEAVPAAFVRPRGTPGTAFASLVFGLISCIPGPGFVAGIIAIALGASVVGRMSRMRSERSGAGLAKAGIVLGVLGIVLHLGMCRTFA